MLTRTRWGKLITAVIHDREMALIVGINVRRLFVVTFCAGAFWRAWRRLYRAHRIGGARLCGRCHRAQLCRGGDRRHGLNPWRDRSAALLVGLLRALAVHKLPS